jgi:enoyl-CoA hydratase/carnithine racemase
VRAIVLTGAGEKAFCTGIDRSTAGDFSYDPLTYEDPGKQLGPKSQGLWKPVVAAVNGMACGGAFYLLGEADVVIAAEHATFFDPHVTYGMVAAYEPILLLPRMAFGEVLRMALAGANERMSAERAMAAGLVSEVVPAAELRAAAHRLASIFASQPPLAVQATLRTIWAARDLHADQATALGNAFLQLGTSQEALTQGQAAFASGQRIEPRVR